MNYPRIDRPTEPGNYWHRRTPRRDWVLADVFAYQDYLMVSYCGCSEAFNLDQTGGEWMGPIPRPPKE